MNLAVESLFNLDECLGKDIFKGLKYPWEALSRIKTYLLEFSENLPEEFEQIDQYIWVGKGTTIEKSALIKGPAIIGCNCEIRQCAYIRENVIIGDGAVIGNSTELKNSLLFNKAQVPHFNYVGDSILGYKAHLGAGVICSNLKSNGGLVKVKVGADYIETSLRKFGAIVGDNSEVGCNSVLNPGTVIGKNSIVYPLTSVRGFVPGNHILKSSGELAAKR